MGKTISDRATYISQRTGLGRDVSNLLVKVSMIREEIGDEF